jgi:tetratricopeptide (TPR) repeat protein
MVSTFIAAMLLAQTQHREEAISALEAVRGVYDAAFRTGQLSLSQEANSLLPSPATVSGALGLLRFEQGQQRQALKLHQEEQWLAQLFGDPAQLAVSFANQARILYETGDVVAAEQLNACAEELLTQLGIDDVNDRSALAPGDRERALGVLANNRGCLAAARGDLDEADRLHRRAERLAQQTTDTELLASSLASQATVRARRGDWGAASRLMGEAEQLLRQLGPGEDLAKTLLHQAMFAHRTGRHDDVLPLIEEAESVAGNVSALPIMGEVLCLRAFLAAEGGEPARAAELLQAALVICRQIQEPRLLHKVLSQRARVLLAMNEPREALEVFVQDTEVCRQLDERGGLIIALFGQVWTFENLFARMRPEDLPLLVDRNRPATLLAEAGDLLTKLDNHSDVHIQL